MWWNCFFIKVIREQSPCEQLPPHEQSPPHEQPYREQSPCEQSPLEQSSCEQLPPHEQSPHEQSPCEQSPCEQLPLEQSSREQLPCEQLRQSPTLQQLHLFISMHSLTNGWVDQTRLEKIRLSKLSDGPSSSSRPPTVTRSLIINSDLSWKVFSYGHEVKRLSHSPLNSVPNILCPDSLQQLLQILDSCHLCPGNPDKHFLSLSDERKGKFFSVTNEITAYEDNCTIYVDGERYNRTIRTSGCSIMVSSGRCPSCTKFRSSLRSMYSRWKKKSQSPKKFSNNRYLTTPQKSRKLSRLQARAISAEREIRLLSEKISLSTKAKGITVDPNLHSDLCSVMNENNPSVLEKFPEGSFRRLFWEQQFKAANVSRPQGMKWHPMMIRWCLNLKLLSTSCYHALRSSGFVKLPSERNLRDYTHYVKSRSGFQADIDDDLAKEADIQNLPEWKKYVILLIDEMKIKESLVYDKNAAKIIGFIDLGTVGNQLLEFEQSCQSTHTPIATHMLVLMVRGIFMHLEYPYAHFPTHKLSGADIFSIVWEAIERLEFIGFKVLVVTADGASPNRKFFSLHGKLNRTQNPYSLDDRYIYFVSDVPHLLKTARNCWSHSGAHGMTRHLWV